MTRRLIVLLVLSLVILGCPANNSQPPTDTGNSKAAESTEETAGLRTTLARQRELVVYVSLDASNVPVAEPDAVVLTDPGQKVVWYSCEGDVTIKFKNSKLPDPTCAPQGQRRCEMAGPPANTPKGDYEYGLTLTVNGTPYVKDPVIIIEY